MKLQDQVCSLELAKRLKELGIKQETQFYHVFANSIDGHTLEREVHLVAHISQTTGIIDKWISAFTVAELMELLPNGIDTKNNEPFNHFRFNMQRSVVVEEFTAKRSFIVNYHCDTFQVDSGSPFFALTLIKHNIWDYGLPDALAKTLIYLIENGYLKI